MNGADRREAAALLRRAAYEWLEHAARMEACAMRPAESRPFRQRGDDALRLAQALEAWLEMAGA